MWVCPPQLLLFFVSFVFFVPFVLKPPQEPYACIGVPGSTPATPL